MDQNKFKEHKVVGDVIDEFASDVALLKVEWGPDCSAQQGNVVTPRQMKDQPTTLEWSNAQADSFYTLIMTDPDAPSRADPKYGQFQHWLVVNIPGSDLAKGLVKTSYIGSGAPPNTALHRYIFLVYKQQQAKQSFDAVLDLNKKANKKRVNFKAR